MAKKKAIVLDKRGVVTRAGEKSSEISEEENRKRKSEREVSKRRSKRDRSRRASGKGKVQDLQSVEESARIDRFNEDNETPKEAALRGAKVGAGIGLTIGTAGIGGSAAGAGLALRALQGGKIIKVSKGAYSQVKNTFAVKNWVSKAAKAGVPGKGTSITVNGVKSQVNQIAGRAYQTNIKSKGLTKTLLQKAGFTNSAAVNLGVILGSYPFAGFIKEEAIQQLTFSAERSMAAGDIEGAEAALELAAEQVDYQNWEKVLFTIPYANVAKETLDFLQGGVVAIEHLMRRIQKKRGQIEFEGQSLGEEIAQRDAERDAINLERDTAFKESEEQRNEDRDARDAEFDRKQSERDAKAEREARINQQVWKLRREGKFDEADELELTIFE